MQKIDNLLLGVGAMKAATTWLYANLNQHSEIYFTPEKELHYLAEMYSELSPLSRSYRYARMMNYLNKTDPNTVPLKLILERLKWYSDYMMNVEPRNWYPKVFSHKQAQKYCADFSNLTAFTTSEGWDHIKSITNNLKVIFIFRDPRDRLWSHLKFHAQQSGQDLDFVNMPPKELLALGMQKHFWMNSAYFDIVKRLQKNLDDNQLLFLYFDDIHKNPLSNLERVEKFLEIPAYSYSANGIKTKINESVMCPKPSDFDHIFRTSVLRDLDKLEALDINIPSHWRR